MVNYKLSYLGERLIVDRPEQSNIHLQDIAHSLSLLCRFTGHCNKFYSVAQHCIHVSRLAPPHARAWALLHDACEYVLGDVCTPLKSALRHASIDGITRYDWLQDQWSIAIAKRFGVTMCDVKRYDIQSLLTEVRDNGPDGEDPRGWFGAEYADLRPDHERIVPLAPAAVEGMYLAYAAELGIK